MYSNNQKTVGTGSQLLDSVMTINSAIMNEHS